MLTYLIDTKFSDPLDAMESVCETLETESVLKQRRSGLRYWYHPGTAKYLTDHDPQLQAKNKIFVDGDYDETQVTYHTRQERETLPCAHHFLKKYCGTLQETQMEMFEQCLEEYTAATGRKLKKQKKGSEIEDGKQDPDGLVLRRDAALDSLHHCLARRICSHSDCEERLLAKSEREERVRFMKYQAVFSSNRFQYVADVDDENRLQKNPYAKGGPKARENEYLRMRPDEL
jgi:hypothetical protein